MFQFNQHTLQRQGVTVLQSLNLTIQQGEKVALLGVSGAGKSTLLEALRLQQPDQVAWCPQQGALVPMLSVFHNIYMGALERHAAVYNLINLIRPLRRELEAVTQLAAELGISEKLRTSVDRLSGGQAQRTALGRALFSQRPVLLADEPVSSVDEHHAQSLLMLALARHDTAVVALHDRQLALNCCDRIIGLKSGQIVIDGASNQLSKHDLDILYQRR
ncbi:ATP-binding cassette domain-containing protein [Alcanivorax sp. 1008]|uniref:ATP-binding cassette domain-containing protein n=1 Tax=Alcanivorax sp. 1008 TaxID=2816853 RepID=UPI001DDB19DF|nr:ATP-binding cassette domain-containing protein [Alcanivorax sp. 1008]